MFLPYVKHTVTLKTSPDVDGTGVHIDNNVDIRSMNNAEMAMRFTTNLNTGEEFFTDLNGFQTIKRTRLGKIPLQVLQYIDDLDILVSLTGTFLTGQFLPSSQLNLYPR